MTNCTAAQIEFPAFKRRKIKAQFSGGAITSEGGVLLLRAVDQQLELTERIAKQIQGPRDPGRVQHQVVDLLRQRVYGLACGHEDLNDHDTLRNDIAFQAAVEKEQALGSRSTLCRFEQQADRGLMWRVHEELLSTLAYKLIHAIRRIALPHTELAQATCATIRVKLFKIGAVVIRNSRRIRLLLSSHYPFQSLFQSVCQRLCPD